jgi:hypothetical protein
MPVEVKSRSSDQRLPATADIYLIGGEDGRTLNPAAALRRCTGPSPGFGGLRRLPAAAPRSLVRHEVPRALDLSSDRGPPGPSVSSPAKSTAAGRPR